MKVQSMTDLWNETLLCPTCKNAGTASFAQSKEADIPDVRALPEGFKVVPTDYGPRFYCEGCNVAAEP